jgi:hypothetical protein
VSNPEQKLASPIENDPRDYLLSIRDHEELVLRAQNDDHYGLLQAVAFARYMQEHPYEGASDEALRWAQQHTHNAKVELEGFERNNFQHPIHPEHP